MTTPLTGDELDSTGAKKIAFKEIDEVHTYEKNSPPIDVGSRQIQVNVCTVRP